MQVTGVKTPKVVAISDGIKYSKIKKIKAKEN